MHNRAGHGLRERLTMTANNIYKVKNLVNGKCYIGQTSKSVAARLSQHWHSANVLNLPNPFHKAIRKYGKEAFAIETVVVCEQKKAIGG